MHADAGAAVAICATGRARLKLQSLPYRSQDARKPSYGRASSLTCRHETGAGSRMGSNISPVNDNPSAGVTCVGVRRSGFLLRSTGT
jgi:hypothetical protein